MEGKSEGRELHYYPLVSTLDDLITHTHTRTVTDTHTGIHRHTHTLRLFQCDSPATFQTQVIT